MDTSVIKVTTMDTNTYGDRLEAALSKQVRVELTERDMSQQDLAAALGIHKAALSRYMNGHTNWPMPVFFRIAEALNLSAHELMRRAEARIEK
jgi:transcriptional regulator with XRE-family HTH domain